jgi:hypothetical protein
VGDKGVRMVALAVTAAETQVVVAEEEVVVAAEEAAEVAVVVEAARGLLTRGYGTCLGHVVQIEGPNDILVCHG